MTQFSDFSHLNDLENALFTMGFNHVGANRNVLTINSPFYYLHRKSQFLTPNAQARQGYMRNGDSYYPVRLSHVTFIDDKYLDYCESEEGKQNKFFFSKTNIENAVIVDGWNKEGVSQTMFGAQTDLQTAVLKVIEEMKDTGKTLDEVLNGDILERCKNIFGEERASKIGILKSDNLPDLNAKSISEHIQPKMPNKEKIQEFIEIIADEVNAENGTKNIDELKATICEYLDKFFDPYSVERMNVALKNINIQIQDKVHELGKTMDDVVYVISKADKSYSLISYQYSLVNDIPYDKFIFDDFDVKSATLDKKPLEKGKVYVVLDDIAGTGESLAEKEKYDNFRSLIFNDENTNLILAPIHMTDAGKRRFDYRYKHAERQDVDFYVTSKFDDSENELRHFFSGKGSDAKKIIGGNGYKAVATSVMFPFCITDTNTSLASFFSTYFIRFPKNIMKFTSNGVKNFKDEDEEILRKMGTYNAN